MRPTKPSLRTLVVLAAPLLALAAVGCKKAGSSGMAAPSDAYFNGYAAAEYEGDDYAEDAGYEDVYEQQVGGEALAGSDAAPNAPAPNYDEAAVLYEADAEPAPESAPEPMTASRDAAEVELAAAPSDRRSRRRGRAARRDRRERRKALAAKPAPQPTQRPHSPTTTPKTATDPQPTVTTPPKVATGPMPTPLHDTEAYDHIAENDFIAVADDPRSTFSIDVDTASYSNTRRFITEGRLPPPDAVRIEELINYFEYDYPQPTGDDPFSVVTEVGPCPWNGDHRLVHVGLQGKTVATAEIPPRNLVFLLDVSGSMSDYDKLPLLKQGMRMLAEQMRPQDRVSIVVYAGASGVVLPPTADRHEIIDALSRLEAGGSTNGGAGIELAYALATESFVKGGINRVILATDGDFNVGTTNQGDLVRLIEQKRESGVFLSVLGFGRGNLKDSTMEQLADKGNGNYAYIDSSTEAHKVLVEQSGATLMTIAKDVKIQVELNPAEVLAYRLVGYENRKLAHRDFNDDTKDAGEIGAGHTVTAIYEIVPVGHGGEPGTDPQVDPLEYQDGAPSLTAAAHSGELMTVKLRYKRPTADKSTLIKMAVRDGDGELGGTSEDFRFSAAVAEMGLLLRHSKWRSEASWTQVHALAAGALGADPHGRRAEFLGLVRQAAELSGESLHASRDRKIAR